MILVVALFTSNVYASVEELGSFGGVSAGKNLPKTINENKKAKKSQLILPYKEVVFVSGEPLVFEGEITIKRNTDKVLKTEEGSYKEAMTIVANNGENSSIKKDISYTVDYRTIDNDFTKQVVASVQEGSVKWNETLAIGGTIYKLNSKKSVYSMSEVTDHTPGVAYFDRSISSVAYYDYDENEVVVTRNGSSYGYEQPWSKHETADFQVDVTGLGDKNLVAKTKSTVNAKKEIYFDKTSPYPISFAGTYNQRLLRDATLTYDVLSGNNRGKRGQSTIKTPTIVEKLPIPAGMDFLRGHWAEGDIKKLYSMDIYTDMPHQGMQTEAITRGDYVKALVRAMKIDMEIPRKQRNEVIFGDVLPDNEVYPYIMAAYRANLVRGVGESFSVDRPISRQEAFVILIRVIGLARLGGFEGAMTPFVDDDDIAIWAKKDINAARRLGIIKGDEDGKVHPNKYISKGEAAAIINRLIDYLRTDIAKTYKN